MSTCWRHDPHAVAQPGCPEVGKHSLGSSTGPILAPVLAALDPRVYAPPSLVLTQGSGIGPPGHPKHSLGPSPPGHSHLILGAPGATPRWA